MAIEDQQQSWTEHSANIFSSNAILIRTEFLSGMEYKGISSNHMSSKLWSVNIQNNFKWKIFELSTVVWQMEKYKTEFPVKKMQYPPNK